MTKTTAKPANDGNATQIMAIRRGQKRGVISSRDANRGKNQSATSGVNNAFNIYSCENLDALVPCHLHDSVACGEEVR